MARSKRALQELAGLSKDPWRFYPEWTFEARDDDLKWQNLEKTHAAGRAIAEEMKTYGKKLESDDVYKPEAVAQLKRQHYEKVVAPKYQEFRDKILSDLRSEARTSVVLAEREALKLPETPFEVAAAMRALDRVYAGVKANGGSKKLRLHDLEQLDPEVRRAIAAAPALVSGLRDEEHEIIRQKVFAEEGGVALAEAQELLSAVETAAEAIAYAEAVSELYASVPNRSPEAERAAAMRDEIQEDRSPGEVVATVEN